MYVKNSNYIQNSFNDVTVIWRGTIYTELQKKRRNFNNSIRNGKQSVNFFSLNYKFLLQHKVLVLITKS